MQWLYPGFLWALTALAIPVIIHLFYFRRYKKVYFTNVSLLKEVKEESAIRNRLKHLLVLLSRLLALLFLVFAFAQPFIPGNTTAGEGGKSLVNLYIDNSFSMTAVDGNLRLIDKARAAAADLVRGYDDDTRFRFITNDFEGRHQRLMSKEEVLSQLDELDISPAVKSLAEVNKRIAEKPVAEQFTSYKAYVISDFQKSAGAFTPDSFVQYSLVKLSGTVSSGLMIDSCYFLEPVQVEGMKTAYVIRLKNTGTSFVENVRLSLKLNGETKYNTDVSVAAEATTTDTFYFMPSRTGWHQIEVQLVDYPVQYDDSYFDVFFTVANIPVLIISDESRPNPFLKSITDAVPYLNARFVSQANLTAEQIDSFSAIIPCNLDNINIPAIDRVFDRGATVIVFPGSRINTAEYARLFGNAKAPVISGTSDEKITIDNISIRQPLFADIFENIPSNISLPEVLKRYTFSRSALTAEEGLLTLRGTEPFFAYTTPGNGRFYFCASTLDKEHSTFPIHSLFAPLMHRILLLSAGNTHTTYSFGTKTLIETGVGAGMGDKALTLRGEGIEFIPPQYVIENKVQLSLGDQVRKAGFYSIERDDATIRQLALNFSRDESETDFFTNAELKEQYKVANVRLVGGTSVSLATVVQELERGTPLWKYCLLLALVFLAVEIALLRLWRQ